MNEDTQKNPEPTEKKTDQAPVKNKEEKKESLALKKPKKAHKKHSKKETVITASILAVLWMGIGATAGYFGYRLFGPKPIIASKTGSVGYIPSKEEMTKMLSSPDFLTAYKDKTATLANYALSRQADYPYSLTITRGSTMSVGVEQKINSYNLRYPESNFFENISSGFISTAQRYYDDGSKITAYQGKHTEDYPTLSPKIMTYDEYIQAYGKLFRGKYYCTTSEEEINKNHLISDVFLTNDKDVYQSSAEKSKHEVNDIVTYYLRPNYVQSQTLEKTATGYKLTMDLNVRADSYFVAQINTTGGVGVPVFQKTDLTFELDDSMELVKGHFEDQYQVMGMACSQSLDLYFYHNEKEGRFNDVEIHIPTPKEVEDQTIALVPQYQ